MSPYIYDVGGLPEHLIFITLLVTVLAASVIKRKLTSGGALTAIFVAGAVYLGAGFTGIAMLAAFFVLGTAATAWQQEKKVSDRAYDTLQRKSSQVAANGGVAALCGLLCFIFPSRQDVFLMTMAGALSTATADTLSSEVGTLYGTHFINILTFKRDQRGLDGVISMEGLLTGIVGSVIIASIYMFGNAYSIINIFIIVVAGLLGNISDSVLGAAFERNKMLGNDTVNFTATLIGAVVAGIIFILM